MAGPSRASTATLQDIAERAGVSTMTVSRALREGDTYQRPTFAKRARRIRRIADELGYRPNAAATAMRVGQFRSVGLLLSTVGSRSELPGGLLHGVHDALAERDFHLTLVKLPDERLTDAGFVPRILREWMTDGLLINYNALIPAKLIQILHDRSMPSIWMNSKQSADCVYPDDYESARLATRKLIEAGHRRIAYVDYSTRADEAPWHYSGLDRQAGHATAMAEAGLTFRRIGDGLMDRRERTGHLTAALGEAGRPSGVLAYTGRDGMLAMRAAELAGLSVPQDVSVACFMGDRRDYFGRDLSGIALPETQIGRRAVEMLMERIETPTESLPPAAVPGEWRDGETVSSPKGEPNR